YWPGRFQKCVWWIRGEVTIEASARSRRSISTIPQGGSTVRTLLVFLAGATLVTVASASGALGASPHPKPSLSLRVSSYRVLYGHTTTISGKLNGGHVAGRAVAIDAWPYGRSAPNRLAVVRTGADGRWSFDAAPRIRTTYWAVAGPTTSRRLTV